MASARQVNLARIRFVARHLADLRETVAFLGGSVVGLLITDSAAPELRPTLDVDVIADVTSRSDYYRLEESLRSLGFTQSAVSGHPVCRWAIGEVIVDVMPTDESILGFSNHWYAPAIANAVALEIDEDLVIRVVTAPFPCGEDRGVSGPGGGRLPSQPRHRGHHRRSRWSRGGRQ